MYQPLARDNPGAEQISALYQRYALQIFNYLRLHLRSKEDAEDLLVEIFLACLESPAFHHLAEAQQRAWLWRVVHNKLIDCHRKRTIRQRTISVDNLVQEIYYDEDLLPEQLMERSEDYLLLHQLVKELPQIQQQILRLRLVNGLRCKEIGIRLGKSETAIRALFSRTLNLLRFNYRQKQGENND